MNLYILDIIFPGYKEKYKLQNNRFRSRKVVLLWVYIKSDLDCMNIVIHHYFKWLSLDSIESRQCIQRNKKERLTRTKPINLIRKYDVKPPKKIYNKIL